MAQLAEVTTVKKSQYDTVVGLIMFVTTKFHYSGRQYNLINELRCCFHKHLHFCEISDKLHVHCDIKHKNYLSHPAFTI